MGRALAYAAVYVLWGASFLAVREIVLAVPPLLAAGFRFTIAGFVLIVWSRMLGAKRPSRRELLSTAALGLLMFAINYACLFWAEQRVASGFAAIIASLIPVWIFAGEWLWLGVVRPGPAAILGMMLGIGGVVLLVLPGGALGWTAPSLAMLVGGVCWAVGTIWSRRMTLPRSRHASAGLQMGFGGLVLLLAAAAAGEFARVPDVLEHWNVRLTLDMAYLIGAASIAAFLSFVWLIDHEPASRVASHACVNPLIAIAVGALVAGERLAPMQVAGAALVLAGVIVTLRCKAGAVRPPDFRLASATGRRMNRI